MERWLHTDVLAMVEPRSFPVRVAAPKLFYWEEVAALPPACLKLLCPEAFAKMVLVMAPMYGMRIESRQPEEYLQRLMLGLLDSAPYPLAPKVNISSEHVREYLESWTPLHLAARAPDFETVKELLEGGFDPNACTNQGISVLHAALAGSSTPFLCSGSRGFGLSDNSTIADILLEARADVNFISCLGFTALELAFRWRASGRFLFKLLGFKATVSRQSSDFIRPLTVHR